MVSNSYYPSDPRLRRQAEALAAHGYAVDVLCQRQPGEPLVERLHGVNVKRIGVKKYRGANIVRYALSNAHFGLRAAAVLTIRHIQRSYDVVHVYSMPEALVFTALWLRLTGTPLIYDAGDLTTDLYDTKFSGQGVWLVKAILRLQERLCFSFANLIITVHAEYYRRLIQRGVSPARLRIVMNVPDEQLFERTLQASGNRPIEESKRSEFTLVHHGSLVERYGIDLAVQAVATLRERIPGLRFHIYGDGDFRPQLEALISRLEVSDIVSLHAGYVPLETLLPSLAAADAAVVPTRGDAFTDTILPNKLLEYLALGLPTVVTRTTTILAHVPEDAVEYCAPNDAGALAAAMERVWADPEHRRRLAANARAFAAAHPWSKEAATYCTTVDELVGRRR